MDKTITEVLKEIEENENIEILYACEAGSRVWGFVNEESDYDVRFIYKKVDVSDYLSLKKVSDVIEYVGDDFDIVGWDIRKAFNLLYKNNPSLWEWLNSDIIYIDRGIFNIFTGLDDFDRNVLKNHYSSMAHNNWKKYSGLSFSRTKIKKYLYVVRAILCWKLLNHDIYPPLRIQDLLEHPSSDIPDECRRDIYKMINHYQGNGDISEDNVFRINNFILKSLSEMKTVKFDSKRAFEDYDEKFREVVMKSGHDDE